MKRAEELISANPRFEKKLQNDSVYFGATVGRVANRIGRAEFSLNGNRYKLVANDHGNNTLHGI